MGYQWNSQTFLVTFLQKNLIYLELTNIVISVYIDAAVINALIWIFADDSKIAKIVESERDGREMQSTIENVGNAL